MNQPAEFLTEIEWADSQAESLRLEVTDKPEIPIEVWVEIFADVIAWFIHGASDSPEEAEDLSEDVINKFTSALNSAMRDRFGDVIKEDVWQL